MRRVPILIATLALGLLALAAAGRGTSTVAQQGTATTAGHPLVGTWRLTFADPHQPPTLDTFHADGTMTQIGTPDDQGAGVWQATGDRTANVTIVFMNTDDKGNYQGTATVRATAEVDASGDAFTATYNVEGQAPDGTVVFAQGSSTVTAKRVKVEPMSALATPAPGIGTPAPAASPANASAHGATVAIDIKSFAFKQGSIEIAAGTTVKWTNHDIAPHTATGTRGEFDSGRLDQGQSFSYRFDKPGTYSYTCTFHPYMKGTIVVK